MPRLYIVIFDKYIRTQKPQRHNSRKLDDPFLDLQEASIFRSIASSVKPFFKSAGVDHGQGLQPRTPRLQGLLEARPHPRENPAQNGTLLRERQQNKIIGGIGKQRLSTKKKLFGQYMPITYTKKILICSF